MDIIHKIIRKVKSWFLPKHEGKFEYSPEGFVKARRWAKNQPHPKFPDHPSYSLWDHVNVEILIKNFRQQQRNLK